MSKNVILGIDLGTTNSCLAVVEGGEPVVISNAEGKRTTPSIVSFSGTERKIGDPAKRQAVTNPKNTVYSIKRFIGKDYSVCTDEVTRVPYEVKKSASNIPVVNIDGREYTPQEISAMILQKMKKTAEDYLGYEVNRAVITVPAYFGDAERTATIEAGEIAGLKVERIINEPTAAALAYGLDKKNTDAKILVFDCGGGTHDVSVLEIGDGVFEVKSTDGDTHLGGDDFDNAIIEWMVEEFKSENAMDLSKDPMALQRLKDAAEKAKIELSSTSESEINLPYITAKDGLPLHFVKKLTKAKFEQMTAKLVERAMAKDNRSLGRFNLDGIMPAPRGIPQIEVTFDIDANGILSVSAKDKATGKQNSTRIEGGSQLTKEEIEKMKAEAEANAEADRLEREKVEKLNAADSTIFQTERQMKEFGEKLTEEDKTAINEKLDTLKKAHADADVAAIDSSIQALNETWGPISTRLYQESASATAEPTAEATGSEEVQDVDFEDVKN